MAFDLGDALDLLRGLADWPSFGSAKHGPARARVGRWTARALLAVVGMTAAATFLVWLRAESAAAFDRAGRDVVALGFLALLAVIALHVVAAIVANVIDRRRPT